MDELPSNRLRLLIVENDRVTARDLEAVLRRRGFIVVGIAYSASQAHDLMREHHADLALLDIQIDGVDDGIELADQLKKEYGIPFLFITGYSEEDVLERARAIGPAALLRKPFSDTEISACLESVIERRATGERLALRLSVLEAVSDPLPQAVIATDLDGKVVYLNRAAAALTGWEKDGAIGQMIHIVDADETEADDAATPRPEGCRRAVLTAKQGSSIAVDERSAPIRTTDGEAVGLVTVLAPQGEFSHASILSAVEVATKKEEDVSETSAIEEAPAPPTVFPPSQPPAARSEALRKIASLANDPAFQELITKRKPSPTPPTHPPTPVLISALASGSISDALVQSSALQLEEVGDPLIRFDEEGIIRYANAEARRIFAPDYHLIGTQFSEHFDHADLERYDSHFHRPMTSGRRHRFDFHDSARGMWFEVRTYPSQGGVLALFTDITATRLETAEQIRQQRLEGLGLLARGFAHDFNNSLTTLNGNIGLARERHTDDAELQEMLEEAQAAAVRATGLVQQLMTFARGGRPIRERTRVPDLIRRVLTEQRLKHPEIRYQYQSGDPDLIANIDPAQIRRLLENLVTNSAAAMLNGGVLIVRSSRLTPEEVLKIGGDHIPADEDHVLIEVIDTGHGMSESNLNRAFEPYFTTRRENNATGIGLTVCESIAKAHGGFIRLQSKEGKGTIATFCSPLGSRSDESAEDIGIPAYPNFDIAAIPKPSLEEAGESLLVGTRILILEDDAPIRRLMAATLRRAGHEVVETKDGRETIEQYIDAMRRGERFHLLICDLTIENGMGGVETMRHLVHIDPDVLAIVSSGYSDAPAMSSPAAFGFKGVLPKPYAPTELRAAVHRMLQAHRIIS